jgi:hypothetical protein
MELTPHQMKVIERLFAAGFRPAIIPPYEKAVCIRRGDCAAVLNPTPSGGLQLLAPPSYVIDGNFSVKLKRDGGDVFVWKQKEIAATPDRMKELEAFRNELTTILEEGPPQ